VSHIGEHISPRKLLWLNIAILHCSKSILKYDSANDKNLHIRQSALRNLALPPSSTAWNTACESWLVHESLIIGHSSH
jgi:hypothetical protein